MAGEANFAVGAGAEYPLIAFPAEPWTLTAYMQLAELQAGEWADWLNQVNDERQTAAMSFLEHAGALAGPLGGQAEDWLALGAWLYRWFPLVAKPFMSRGHRGDPSWRRGYFQDQPEYRLGRSWTPSVPSDPGYESAADVLLHSVAVDLALLVSGRAQAARQGLRWQASSDEGRSDLYLTPDGAGSSFPLLVRLKEFLVQATARARGQKGHELRRWRTAELYKCFQRASADVPLPEEYEAFPGSNAYREGRRYYLIKPPRSSPEAPEELVAAISAFRTAGWYQDSKLSDVKLAVAAQATWQAYEGEDIPAAAAEAGRRLLVLDGSRTWSEDVDADARPGDDLHETTLWAIARIGGRTLRRLRDPEEMWTDPRGDVEMRLGLGSRKHALRIPAPGRYLSPALITGLNALLPADGDRLWFADHGPPIAIVTRATISERDELQRVTSLQLSLDPPAWWTALAPLRSVVQPAQQTTPPDEDIGEYWERLPADEAHLLGVEVTSGEGLSEPFDWLVTISAREYFRNDPLGQELQQRLESALLAVPGVTSAENASWETWYVTGKASGEAVCQTAATVVDELADRMRAEYNTMFGKG